MLLLCERTQLGRGRMARFVVGYLRFVLQGEANVVEAIQQAVAHELVDGKFRSKSLVVSYLALFQVDGDMVVAGLPGPAH